MEALERNRPRETTPSASSASAPATTGATGRKPNPVTGSPDGDREGTSDIAAEGDRYLALVTQRLRESYVLPTAISEKERMRLQAVVFMRIGRDGSVSESRIQKSSGNELFDRAIELGLEKLSLPPPPDGFLRRYGGGVEIRYRP